MFCLKTNQFHGTSMFSCRSTHTFRLHAEISIKNPKVFVVHSSLFKECYRQMTKEHRVFTFLINQDLGLSLIIRQHSFLSSCCNSSQKCTKEETELHEGDELKFGTNDSIYILQTIPFTVCYSNVNSPLKSKLKMLLSQIGIHSKFLIQCCKSS
jgi:hypothetical protein